VEERRHALSCRPLSSPSGCRRERFASNGQLLTLKRRTNAGIAITGFDFLGHLDRSGSGPNPRLTLAVAKEEELARSFVLENFLRILLAHQVSTGGRGTSATRGVADPLERLLFSGRSNAGQDHAGAQGGRGRCARVERRHQSGDPGERRYRVQQGALHR